MFKDSQVAGRIEIRVGPKIAIISVFTPPAGNLSFVLKILLRLLMDQLNMAVSRVRLKIS